MANFQLVRESTISLDLARSKARDELLYFHIDPEGTKIPTIVGIMKNKPKFSLEATYDRLINMDEEFAFLNKVGGALFNVQLGLSKTWSRKIYKGGSYLEISLQARFINDEFGSVVPRTHRLVSLCNPRGLFEKEMETEYQKSVNNPPPTAEESTTKTADQVKMDKMNAWGRGKDLASGLIKGLANQTPPRCHVKISNFFQMYGFYVKSVNFEFSHEQCESGPLYSDLEIELTQSEIVTAKELQIAFRETP